VHSESASAFLVSVATKQMDRYLDYLVQRIMNFEFNQVKQVAVGILKSMSLDELLKHRSSLALLNLIDKSEPEFA
jgi:hypothetical protein